ncbi:MAG TPA: hypothetical protein VMQ65_04630 [Candidatus Limnocylindria bacterium]|nr:hypothetical protein [Candidatus Limnocylindria bacterium]
MRIWSELRVARLKEQIADVSTVLWVGLWGTIGWQLFELLAGFAEAGRVIRSGGDAMVRSGIELGEALAGVPLVGPGLQDVARNAFVGAGGPLSSFGMDLERFIIVVATVLALVVVLVTLVPWLSRYLPWRLDRLQRTRAGHRAIRVAPRLENSQVESALAMRAVARLDYATLLHFTPDPLGDWTSGRHDRLARAELASVGLRP